MGETGGKAHRDPAVIADHRDRTRENFPDGSMDEERERKRKRKKNRTINPASYITRDRWRFPSYATGSFITRRGQKKWNERKESGRRSRNQLRVCCQTNEWQDVYAPFRLFGNKMSLFLARRQAFYIAARIPSRYELTGEL